MLKLLNTSVAKLVGATSAVVFQHICYWMQTQSKEVIYRTNKQLSEDLDGIYSPQQIQRAKKKLIEEGLIVVTADKRDAWNRTSHYSLTDKGRSLLLSVNRTDNNTTKCSSKNTSKTLADASQNRADSTKEAKTYTKLSENKQAKYERSSNAQVMSNNNSSNANNPLEHNSAMRESFKEGFSNANAVPMPENIKSLFKRKQSVAIEVTNTEVTEIVTDNDSDILTDSHVDVVSNEAVIGITTIDSHNREDVSIVTDNDKDIETQWMYEEKYSDYYPFDNEHYYSDSEYNDCVISMLSSIEAMNHSDKEHSNSAPITFAELMKTAYNKATTEAQEQMYRMKCEIQQYKYCEDF